MYLQRLSEKIRWHVTLLVGLTSLLRLSGCLGLETEMEDTRNAYWLPFKRDRIISSFVGKIADCIACVICFERGYEGMSTRRPSYSVNCLHAVKYILIILNFPTKLLYELISLSCTFHLKVLVSW